MFVFRTWKKFDFFIANIRCCGKIKVVNWKPARRRGIFMKQKES